MMESKKKTLSFFAFFFCTAAHMIWGGYAIIRNRIIWIMIEKFEKQYLRQWTQLNIKDWSKMVVTYYGPESSLTNN